MKSMTKTVVVIPNWNGVENLENCLNSLRSQTLKAHIIVVDNGSVDGSVDLVTKNYPEVELINHSKNMGFAGGVNPGFKRAMDMKTKYVAALNNDAVAEPQWLEKLVDNLDGNSKIGIATCKLLTADGVKIDSTGDLYTVWGLPYPRGRGESDINKYDSNTDVFGASGGASLYRTKMLAEVGLYDEDFFAYYEDVDLSFRAQLAGWKIAFVPESIVYHQISATSGRIKGFAIYQTMKNLQLLFYKNVPRGLRYRIGWRFALAHTLILSRAVTRGQGWPALKGSLKGNYLIMKSIKKRRNIQRSRQVSDNYIWSMIVHDLPPNAKALRSLRSAWWTLLRRKERKSA
jgi:GT2 family glycosyltransferase